MSTTSTAKRRRAQARNGYKHIPKRRRSIYPKPTLSAIGKRGSK